MYDLLDNACAEVLCVDVKVYIEKIEKTSYKRAELIIIAALSNDKKLIEKAKRIFNLIS